MTVDTCLHGVTLASPCMTCIQLGDKDPRGPDHGRRPMGQALTAEVGELRLKLRKAAEQMGALLHDRDIRDVDAREETQRVFDEIYESRTANPLNEPPTWRLSIGDCVDIDSGPKLGGPPRRGFIVGLYMCGDGHLQASWRDLDTSSGGCPARSMTPRGWGWTVEERTNIVNQIRGDDEWLTDDRRKRMALLCRKHPGVEIQRLEYPMLDECPLCKSEQPMADAKDTRCASLEKALKDVIEASERGKASDAIQDMLDIAREALEAP